MKIVTGPVVRPMLAVESDSGWLLNESDSGDWLLQIKFDGMRCLAYKEYEDEVRLETRGGHDITTSFPEVAEALNMTMENGTVFDGELIAYGRGGEHKLINIQKRNNVTNKTKLQALQYMFPAEYVVFDILAINHDIVTSRSMQWRTSTLENVFQNIRGVARADTYLNTGTNPSTLWEFVQSRGLEGVVAKRRYSVYRSGRSSDWRKIKY